MKVCVVNIGERPLMPTTPRKAKILLREGAAKIFRRDPFTIQLLSDCHGYIQPATLGIDAGYLNIGYSALNQTAELIGGEVKMLEGISERITEKLKYRRTRRNRLRYRAPRFDNRRRNDGWLTPSIQHKLDTHHRLIDRIKSVLPIDEVMIEVANFDIQKIKNQEISGDGYQQGEQKGFDNLREYLLHRDGHKCQHPECRNKSKQPILQVHHLGFWKNPPDRTERPGNLITLCNKCHTPAQHKKKGKLFGWEPKIKPFKPETFMSTVRWRLTKDTGYKVTFGHITKAKRRLLKLDKSHHNEAFVIAGGEYQTRCEALNLVQIRRNKRSMEQFYDAKYLDIRDKKSKSGTELFSGRRTRNKNLNSENLRAYRGHKLFKGQRRVKKLRYRYQPHDEVEFEGAVFEVVGMQNQGTGVKLKDYPGIKNKVVKISAVKSVKKRGGICA
ncbi:MAG: paclitaxel/taxanoid biosynthesis susceptibility protein TS1 [Symploca sp. SIO3C6]|nr:paclitaxel/taxanoid biosynthesis susceptibility protein TS1 [Symploca sp. SIO3C6]